MNQQQRAESFARGLTESADDYWKSAKISVFVMGPDTTTNSPGAKLRKEIIALCNAEDLAVKAEHDKIIEAVKRKLRKGFTLTHLEAFIARESDLIVIIPDSPGSFAELGYFALQKNLCAKLIILFDKQYLTEKKSYIARGPHKAAKDWGATVRFIDYLKLSEAWRKILPRIEQVKASKILSRLEAGWDK